MDPSFPLPESNDLLLETIYYIAGYMLKAAEKEGLRHGDKSEVRRALLRLSESVYSTKDGAELANIRSMLPTGKVDRIISFGGLKYPTEEFYLAVWRTEGVYSKVLSDDVLILEGGSVIERVNNLLLANAHLFDIFSSFLPRAFAEEKDVVARALAWFLRTYGRMHGRHREEKDVFVASESNCGSAADSCCIDKERKEREKSEAGWQCKFCCRGSGHDR